MPTRDCCGCRVAGRVINNGAIFGGVNWFLSVALVRARSATANDGARSQVSLLDADDMARYRQQRRVTINRPFQAAYLDAEIPRRSLMASLRFCLHPVHRSVVFCEARPRRSWTFRIHRHNCGRPTYASALEHQMGLLSRFRNLTLAER